VVNKNRKPPVRDKPSARAGRPAVMKKRNLLLGLGALAIPLSCPALAAATDLGDPVVALADPGTVAAPIEGPAAASPAALPAWNVHAQFTAVSQLHPSFTSPYQGANSLDPGFSEKETTDFTLFAGVRLWRGASAFANPEIDQGFGLSNTLGLAGFSSGEAYKVGARNPYFRLPRAFVRQVIGLGGAESAVDDGPNQLAESMPADNIVITAGKYSVVDIFDTNRYAHDPKGDFLNWSVVDAGAFDYAADSWAYTYGGTVEWTQSWWTLRGGAFALSKQPNSKDIDGQFRQFELVTEFEERHRWREHEGKLKVLGFLNRGDMGRYDDAIALGTSSANTPNTALVRRYLSRLGVSLNVEQEFSANLGGFLKASINDGSKEAFEFTEINKSLAAGLSLNGHSWARPDDTVGLASVINGLSGAARSYFSAGGIGILIGDGRLPHYAYEEILEMFYSRKVLSHLTVSGDYQFVLNPAYNRDRGPVSVFGLRLHADF
jgi:high affinity Mn2+ porin